MMRILALVALLSLTLPLVLLSPRPFVASLTIHIVPHSHDDVGWLKTLEQYYTGSNNTIQHAGVRYILDAVIGALVLHPERKFIFGEQAFFQRWWQEQTEPVRSIVRKLIDERRFEFVNGGWCMHDEATTHYIDMIDQTTLGHKFIGDEYGIDALPRVGWQIDPFGHSATQATLLTAEMGLDAVFWSKYDYQDHQYRRDTRQLEFVWRPSPSLGASSQTWAGTFPGLGDYGPPPHLFFDGDNYQPIQDNPRYEDYNGDQYLQWALDYAHEQANVTHGDFATMNIMWYMGTDFEYENAAEWFTNIDRLIKLINAATDRTNVSAIYSTPSIYTYARYNESLQWPITHTDFYPYGISAHAYRTGFYTSRATLKRYVRVLSHTLQVTRQIEVMRALLLPGGESLSGTASQELWEALGTAQHHDAVSGTERQHVAYNYAYLLSKGQAVADAFVHSSLGALTKGSSNASLTFHSCPLTNISVCPATQSNKPQMVVIFNSQARSIRRVVRMPWPTNNASVVDAEGRPLTMEQFSVFPAQRTPATPDDAAPYTLFIDVTLPPVGFTTYFVQPMQSHFARARRSASRKSQPSSQPWSLRFDPTTGMLSSVTNTNTKHTYRLSQNYLYYRSMQDDGVQNSGAYIMRPAEQHPWNATTKPVTTHHFTSPLIEEWQQSINSWLYQTIRISALSQSIEIEWTVGSIPIEDGQGKEVITRFDTDVRNKDLFFSDSNGREFQRRQRNLRPTFNYTVTEPVASNYYPVTAAFLMQDLGQNTSIVVNNDRSQGFTSLADGQFEMMLHRRTLRSDDGNTVEALNETQGIREDGTRIGHGLVVHGRSLISLTTTEDCYTVSRSNQQLIYTEPSLEFASFDGDIAQYRASHVTTLSLINVTAALPPNVELVTLQPWSNHSVLIRLAHTFAVNEGEWSAPVTVDVGSLFVRVPSSVREMNLAGTAPVGWRRRLKWRTERKVKSKSEDTDDGVSVDQNEGQSDTQMSTARLDDFGPATLTLTLTPMTVRTLVLTFD